FALRRALHEAGDVDELHRRGYGALRLHDARELVEPVVGDVDAADVRILRGEGIVRREDAGGGERVEERGLADVGQSDDAESEHCVRLLVRGRAHKANRPLRFARRSGRFLVPRAGRSRAGLPAAAGAYTLRASRKRRARLAACKPAATTEG